MRSFKCASIEGTLLSIKAVTPLVSEMKTRDKFCSIVAELLSIPKFNNETDVREDFLVQLIKALGYSNSGKCKIEREITFDLPELMVGSRKKKLEQYSPDYILNVDGRRKWVIDAKGPSESVLDEKNIGQAYSYSIHREVNVPYFVLCNGEEFAVFRTSDQSYKPTTIFKRYELDYRWKELYEMFSVPAFRERLKVVEGYKNSSDGKMKSKRQSDRDEPISRVIVPRKQASCIHNGTHPYFTKRAWNVVRDYVTHFTKGGETVLDPYGGAGVTIIESMLMGRKGIHVDINPIANFMTKALATPVKIEKLNTEYQKILEKFEKEVNRISKIKKPTTKLWYPKKVKLPKNADVEYLDEYFSNHQIVAMAYLRNEISRIKDKDIKDVLMLVFSSTLVKCNKSFHNTGRDPNKGGGDAGFLKYYRYQIPKKRYPEVDPVEVFKKKYLAVLKCKKEVLKYIDENYSLSKNIQIKHGTATNLDWIKSNSIDYIFTDPPYGSKIAYLDCSILWNSWLKEKVSKNDLELEVISGGELQKNDEQYIKLLQKSLDEIHRVLKPDRWFSIVFASQNPRFWHAIRDYCIKIGFEHINTVCQPSDRKSVKKNQNPLTVFSGELILNFRKRKSGRNIVGVSSSLPPQQYVLNSAELSIVSRDGRATLEDIMQDLIPKLWESGLLGAVSNEIDDLTTILKDAFDFDKKDKVWQIKKKAKLGCHIPLESRMKFYILSALNKGKNEGRDLTVDEIIMEVMPYLRNGITPSNQDIITELKNVAVSIDGEHWKINLSTQLKLL